jgi:hypothetical protein
MKTPLNNRLRPCEEKVASFLSTTLRSDEVLETYSKELASNAQAWAEGHKGQSIGKIAGNPRRTLCGFELEWGENKWELHAPTFSILIEPECNQEDINQLLQEIGKLEPILIRGVTHREIMIFHIGAVPDKPCVAFAKGNRLGFPLCKDNNHILATSICNASPEILLENIILHELDHTLKKYLNQELNDLSRNLPKSFTHLGEETKQISPHYLGKQHANISHKLLMEAATADRENTPEAHRAFNKTARKIISETFAEMVRFYYLGPVLSGKTRKAPKTKCHTYNQVAQTLEEEAKRTLHYTIGKKPFPQKGEIPDFD